MPTDFGQGALQSLLQIRRAVLSLSNIRLGA